MKTPRLDKVRVPKSINPGPKTYALTAEGVCLQPAYNPGDIVVCDPDQMPEPGDFVAIWWKGGLEQPSIKRLTMGLPKREWWNVKGDFDFILAVEQINPFKALSAPLSKVDAVHKVIHRIPVKD